MPAAASTATTPAARPPASTRDWRSGPDPVPALVPSSGAGAGAAHRSDSGAADIGRAVAAEVRLGAGLCRRRRRHRSQRRQQAARRRVEQPLDAGPWLAVDADFALDPRPLRRRPDRIPERGRQASASVGGDAARASAAGRPALQWRYLGAGALVDDDSVRSHPSSTSTCGWRATCATCWAAPPN